MYCPYTIIEGLYCERMPVRSVGGFLEAEDGLHPVIRIRHHKSRPDVNVTQSYLFEGDAFGFMDLSQCLDGKGQVTCCWKDGSAAQLDSC